MEMRGGLSGEAKNVFKPFDDGELQPDRRTAKIYNDGRSLCVGYVRLSWRITFLVQQDVLSRRTERLPTLPHLVCHHSNPLSGLPWLLDSDGSNSPPSGLSLA